MTSSAEDGSLAAAPSVAEQPMGTGERARRAVAWRWTKLLGTYFSAQAVVQVLAVATGLLLVNVLPVREFALYTLATSVASTLAFATDLGSTGSLLFFRRESREPGSFETFVEAVLSLRKAVLPAAALAAAVALAVMSFGKGYGATEVALSAVAIVVAAWFQIQGSVGLLLYRMDGRYGVSYRAEVLSALVRLACVALLLAAQALAAGPALAAAAIAAVVLARSTAPALAPCRGASRDDVRAARKRILRYLLPTLPAALYFTVQGPLVVWMATSFGDARNVAEVGALGRLALLAAIFGNLASVVFLPRLSGTADETVYKRRFLGYGGLLAAAAGGLCLLAAVAPDLFLFLLGPHYRGLHEELLLVVAATGFTLVGGYLVAVNNARAWTRQLPWAVLGLLVGQALFAALLPLSETRGVLWFGLLSSLLGLLFQVATTVLGFHRRHWVAWRA